MKYLLLFALFFISCNNDRRNTANDSYPYLILGLYSLDNSKFKFCCFDSKEELKVIDKNTYYKYNDFSYMSYIEGPLERIREDKLHDDLLNFLFKSDTYKGFSLNCIDEPVRSITIYSDYSFREIDPGESLNDFFSLEGEFVVKNRGHYELYYKGDNILKRKETIHDEILFPDKFRLRLLKSPSEKGFYNFYMRLEFGSKNIEVLIVKINLI